MDEREKHQKLNGGLECCDLIHTKLLKKHIKNSFTRIKHVTNSKKHYQFQILTFARALIRQRTVNDFLKLAKKFSGKKSKISKIKLFITIVENLFRTKMFEHFLELNQHHFAPMSKTKDNLEDSSFNNIELRLDDSADDNRFETMTPYFNRESDGLAGIDAEVIKKMIKSNFNSENNRRKHDQYVNFVDNLMNVRGSVGSFEDLKDLGEEINSSFKDPNGSYTENSPKELFGFQQRMTLKSINSSNQITIPGLPGNEGPPQSPIARFSRYNDYNNNEIFDTFQDKLKHETKRNGQDKSTRSKLLQMLNQKINELSLKMNFNNHVYFGPFLNKFQNIREAVNKARHIDYQKFLNIQQVVDQISVVLELTEKNVSTLNYNSIYNSIESKKDDQGYNERYRKRLGSRASRSIESLNSDQHRSINSRQRNVTPNKKNDAIDIKICVTGSEKVNEWPKDFNLFEHHRTAEGAQIFLRNPNQKGKTTQFTTQFSNIMAFTVGLNLIIRRRMKRNRKIFLHNLRNTRYGSCEVMKAQRFFNGLIVKWRLSRLVKLKFWKKRKDTTVTELFFRVTKHYFRLKKEVVWTLRNQKHRKFAKLGWMFGLVTKSERPSDIGKRYYSVSPKHASQEQQIKSLFSKSINNNTLADIRQMDADSFFVDLEKEYNACFLRTMSFVKK